MIKEYPDYYKCFSCVADKCPETCCAGWEIGIDEETYYFYQTVTGKTRERLNRYLKEDEDGYHFQLTENGRCPFLNERNLCDLYMEFGERGMSITCKEHPRFITECGEYSQVDLSLSCPEAGRLFFETPLLPKIERERDEFSAEGLESVEKGKREQYLKKRNNKLKDIRECDSIYLLMEKWLKEEEIDIKKEPLRIEEFLKIQEIRDDSWKELIIGKAESTNIKKLFEKHEPWTRKLIYYFIFRYTMDEFYEGEAFETDLMALRGTVIILLLSEEIKGGLPLASRKFSSEIEYSEKNASLIRMKKPSAIPE